jgi:hypothetical protein
MQTSALSINKEHIKRISTVTKLLAPNWLLKTDWKTRPNKLLVYLSDKTKPCSNVLQYRNTIQLNIRHLLPALLQNREDNTSGTHCCLHVCQ